MNKAQIEAMVNDHVNHVVADRGKIEDDLVEAKSQWPTPDKAKQLAGMANAAHGQTLTWIVGLHEGRHEVVSFDDVELADWWPQVQSQFAHDVTPDISTLTVHTGYGKVVCVRFETDRAPYLVKNSEGGWAKAAVPWRAGTGTRTATRAELLSLLSEATRVPTLELVEPSVFLTLSPTTRGIPMPKVDYEAPSEYSIMLRGGLFIDAEPGKQVVLPKHKWMVALRANGKEVYHFEEVSFHSARQHASVWTRLDEPRPIPPDNAVDPYGVTDRPVGLVVRGPDRVEFHQYSTELEPEIGAALRKFERIEVEMRFPVGSTDREAVVVTALAAVPNPSRRQRAVATWILPAEVDAGRSKYKSDQDC